MKIFLIGMMGSGKSTVGKLLASRLKMEFVDMDTYIEQQEKISISEIFNIKGERYFRDLETKVLLELISTEKELVIACGGGLPVDNTNLQLCLERGRVVYLSCSPEILYQRIENDSSRPLLSHKTSFLSLFNAREKYYQKAHFMVDASKSPLEVCDQILDQFRF